MIWIVIALQNMLILVPPSELWLKVNVLQSKRDNNNNPKALIPTIWGRIRERERERDPWQGTQIKKKNPNIHIINNESTSYLTIMNSLKH